MVAAKLAPNRPGCPSLAAFPAFEITSGVLRLMDSPTTFRMAVAVVGDEGTATVKALQAGRFTRADWRDVTAILRAAGFRTLRYTRHTPAGVRTRRRSLRANQK